MKKSYQAPRLTVHGTVAELTLAGTKGKNFDGNFHTGQTVPTNGSGQPIIFS